MSGRERQRGFGFKGVLALLVFVSVVYLGYKVVPAYVNNYQFQDFLDTEAKFALVNHKSEEDLRDSVFKKARDIDLPIKREQIKINVDSRGIRISISYVIPVELPGYTWELAFTPSADSRYL